MIKYQASTYNGMKCEIEHKKAENMIQTNAK